MLNAQALVLALSIGLIPLLFSTVYRRFSKATRNPFPGPTPIPIIGNILPSRRIGTALGALSKKYVSKLPEWLPGMQFKARAYEWRRHYDMVAQSAYQYVESEIAKGTARPSMVYKALVGKSNEKMSKDIVMYSAAQVYTAEEVAFTVIALLLSLFDISNAHDTNGDPIIPPLEQTEGSIVYVISLSPSTFLAFLTIGGRLPLPFPCVIQPRDIGASEQAEKFYNMYYQLEESI
ncbi:hypothetical protein TRAPUB_327 [Trametes pubescens]|uniref:O-methylsterigmatocystin oxidoreductase n=1 Tax=Trametes pubescens TaxID=154538 RepID=A0A1M2VMK5_TRAPU|nr:hypothetical protein TRAPUB_327 [Trametes pubescens]